MSKIPAWVFQQINQLKTEKQRLQHRTKVLETKLEEYEKTGPHKKIEGLEQPAQPTSLMNPEEAPSQKEQLIEEVKALRTLLDRSEGIRTQQMEFIRKIRNSCQRFTWSNQLVMGKFEKDVEKYLRDGVEGDEEEAKENSTNLGFRKQLETMEEKVSKRARKDGLDDYLPIPEIEKEETQKKRGPRGPRKKKQENIEEGTKIFNVFRDKESISKYFPKEEDINFETEVVKTKRKPGRPSKKEMQRREEEQKQKDQKVINRGKALKERMIMKLKESVVKQEEDDEPKVEEQQPSEHESPQVFDLDEEEKDGGEKSSKEEPDEVEIALNEDEEEEEEQEELPPNSISPEEKENSSEQEVILGSEEKS